MLRAEASSLRPGATRRDDPESGSKYDFVLDLMARGAIVAGFCGIFGENK